MNNRFVMKFIFGLLILFSLMSFRGGSIEYHNLLKGHPKFLKLYKGQTFVFENAYPQTKALSPFQKLGNEFLVTPKGFVFASGKLVSYTIDSIYKASPKKLLKSGLIKGQEPDPLYPQEQVIVYRFPELNSSIVAFDEEFGEIYQGKYYQWGIGEYLEHEPKLGYAVILTKSTDAKTLDKQAKGIANRYGDHYSPAIFKNGKFYNFKAEESIVTDEVTYHYIKRTSDDFGSGISLEKVKGGEVELIAGVYENEKAAKKRLHQLIKEYPAATVALRLFDNNI